MAEVCFTFSYVLLPDHENGGVFYLVHNCLIPQVAEVMAWPMWDFLQVRIDFI